MIFQKAPSISNDDQTSHLDMRFDFSVKLLEVLYDRSIDCSTQICVLVGDAPGLLSNCVINILSTRNVSIQ